ncbi:insulinase family protein [Duganella sp. BJB1802]|uniref:insulinase family protein n=1 Tax=Duganella sp. BJB1802 TaxID=2744575 RepID=UPI001594D263|nr:insulinase family protein [Duganella sp. BJB1802]NVD70998.1 insulinase family protein [Duganella sp. BJB1802]
MIAFEKIRSHAIPALHTTVEEYLEPSSGARHIHLVTERADLTFLVAFPTVPESSDGRAHILEHLALCGSRRYPVRAPFFSMLRRSTASFMNAMTYADRTVYPFASTDRNDFFNLLDVYLDATFFPKLDYLSFRQEGWRYTLEDGKLNYQGVVFNEMKGAFTDPMRALHGGLTEHLLEGTTYAVESGGDPLAIPELSHEMLKQFHASHYHPSQAVFMSSGPIAAAEVQQRIAERVLAELPGKAPRRLPQLASVTAPRTATIAIPARGGGAADHGVQLSWVLGEAADPLAYHHAELLQAGLLGDASAPLRQAMESAGYGRPAAINGFDAGARQILFHLGMEGLTEAQTASARSLLWRTLERVAETGVPAATLQASLRDSTFDQRDTSGGRMPNVLSRMLNALPVVMRGGDAIAAFDNAGVLERLRSDVADPDFFPRMVRNKLLDNPARLDARVRPDAAYFADRAAIERGRLDAIQATLSPADLDRIAAEGDALDALQRAPVDSSVLPRIRPADVSPQPLALPAVVGNGAGKYVFSIPSNGISYARVQFDASALAEEDWPWLSLYASLREDLGVAGMDFEQAGAWRGAQVSRYAIGANAAQGADGALHVSVNFFAGALREEHVQIAAVLDAWIYRPRFDEEARIRFLIDQMAHQRLDSLAQDGDRYARIIASAPLSPLRAYEHATDGAAFVPFLAGLQALLATPRGLQQISERLARLHERVTNCPRTILLAGSGDDGQALSELFPAHTAQADAAAAPPPAIQQAPANVALYASSQINHCHIAWATPDLRHRDAPALAVAAQLLSHQLLHQALRERGGAYGGYAGYVESAGTFTMSSYRDPRLAGTYADFATALERVMDTAFSSEQLEEAIICVIQKLDHPASPFETVTAAWTLHQRGIDLAARRQFRTGVLACKLEEVRAAVDRWLRAETPSRAASAGNIEQDLAGLQVLDLMAFGKGETALASATPA